MKTKTETNGKKRPNGQAWPLDVRVGLARAVVEQKLSASSVAGRLGVPYTTAVDWVRRYRKGGAAALEPRSRPAAKTPGAAVEVRRAAILATHEAEP